VLSKNGTTPPSSRHKLVGVSGLLLLYNLELHQIPQNKHENRSTAKSSSIKAFLAQPVDFKEDTHFECDGGANRNPALGNTYHLSLRPDEGVVRDLGGPHQFFGW